MEVEERSINAAPDVLHAPAAPLHDESRQPGSTLASDLMSLEAFTTLANNMSTTSPTSLVAAYAQLLRAHDASLAQLALLRFVGSNGQFLTDAILTRLARLADENERLADVVREASQRLRSAEEAADAADARAGEAESALLDAQAAAATLQLQLDERSKQIDSAQSSLQESESRVASLMDENRQLKEENQKLLRHSQSRRDSATSTRDGRSRSSGADKHRTTGEDGRRGSHAASGTSRHRSEPKDRREARSRSRSRSRDRVPRHNGAQERQASRKSRAGQNVDDAPEGSADGRENGSTRRHREDGRQRDSRHRRSPSSVAADARDVNDGAGNGHESQRGDKERDRRRDKERSRPRSGSTSSRTRSRSPKRSRRTHSSASDASTSHHAPVERRNAALERVEEDVPPAASRRDGAAATAKTSEGTSMARRDRHSIMGRLGLPISAGSGQQKGNGDTATNGQSTRSFGIRGRGKAASKDEAGRDAE